MVLLLALRRARVVGRRVGRPVLRPLGLQLTLSQGKQQQKTGLQVLRQLQPLNLMGKQRPRMGKQLLRLMGKQLPKLMGKHQLPKMVKLQLPKTVKPLVRLPEKQQQQQELIRRMVERGRV